MMAREKACRRRMEAVQQNNWAVAIWLFGVNLSKMGDEMTSAVNHLYSGHAITQAGPTTPGWSLLRCDVMLPGVAQLGPQSPLHTPQSHPHWHRYEVQALWPQG